MIVKSSQLSYDDFTIVNSS